MESLTTLDSVQSITNSTPIPVRPKTPHDYEMYNVAKDLMQYQILVLFSVGVPANCINMAVLLRKNMRSSSPSVYFLALAVFDALALFGSLLGALARFYYPEMVSMWFCRAVFFTQGFSSQASAWSVVVMTSERLVVVMFPLKASRWCSVRNARIAVLVYTAVCVGFQLQYFWTGTTYLTFCTFDNVNYGDFLDAWTYVDSIMTVYVPVTVVLVLNILIIRQMRRASSQQQAMTGDSASKAGPGVAGRDAAGVRAAKQTRQITTMLVTVSVTFLLLTTPYGAFFIMSQVTQEKQATDPWYYALVALLQQLCVGLFLLNHSLNFFLYCVMGRKFRSELIQMLSCGRFGRRKRAHGHAQKGTTTTGGVTNGVSSSQITLQTIS